MKFYVSVRPFRIANELIYPSEHLRRNFVGLNINSDCIGDNRSIDGRLLYEISIDDAYSEQEQEDIKAVILESLSMFGVHAKTPESAQALALKLCGIEPSIIDGALVFPAPSRQ